MCKIKTKHFCFNLTHIFYIFKWSGMRSPWTLYKSERSYTNQLVYYTLVCMCVCVSANTKYVSVCIVMSYNISLHIITIIVFASVIRRTNDGFAISIFIIPRRHLLSIAVSHQPLIEVYTNSIAHLFRMMRGFLTTNTLLYFFFYLFFFGRGVSHYEIADYTTTIHLCLSM